MKADIKIHETFENADKYAKKIKKAERLKDYEAVVASLFLECKIMHDKEWKGVIVQISTGSVYDVWILILATFPSSI